MTVIFNIFTNARSSTQPFCDDVKRLGNIVFSVSLEGFKPANDGRRGEGSFDKVMACLGPHAQEWPALRHSDGLHP
jgi:sulfatase maturation enzyme AslB (radical SAM superfamily)